MLLDVQTLLVAMLAQVFALAIALPAVMGSRVSFGARRVQVSAVAQALGWASLLNRRAFAERAAGLMAQARRCDTPLSLLLIDIDHFKSINERLGHAGGDRALQTLGHALRESLRGGDVTGRRPRRMVREHAETEHLPSLRFSAGQAVLRADDRSIEQLVARADDALYQAKAQCRDRTVEFAPAIVAASS